MKRTRTAVLLMLLCLLLWGCQVDDQYRWAERLTAIDDIVAKEIDSGNIPGAVVLVGQRDRILYWKAFGSEVIEPYNEPMTKHTIFDMASVTKPVATATSIMILADRGRLNLNDHVSVYLPAFGCEGKEEAQIRHLLTHTSGLPPYTNAKNLETQYGRPCADAVIEKICSLSAASPPGEQFRYSCLGYITLAQIVKIVSGQDINEFSRESIFRPLGMRHTTFNPPASWQKNIAATQIENDHLLRGSVHDPLAQLRDGLGGNAGLFSSAPDLAVYCRMLLNEGKLNRRTILSPEAVRQMTTVQSHGRAFGFDISSGYSWVKGRYAPPQTFCHTGYTGTSIVCDPASGIYVIILTNRAHPHDKGSSRPTRTGIAEIVFPPPEP